MSPTKISARIEAEKLPQTLEENLSSSHVAKLKQLQYEHAKSIRTQKALKIILTMQQKLEELEQEG